jgi:hypothetical protein
LLDAVNSTEAWLTSDVSDDTSCYACGLVLAPYSLVVYYYVVLILGAMMVVLDLCLYVESTTYTILLVRPTTYD